MEKGLFPFPFPQVHFPHEKITKKHLVRRNQTLNSATAAQALTDKLICLFGEFPLAAGLSVLKAPALTPPFFQPPPLFRLCSL